MSTFLTFIGGTVVLLLISGVILVVLFKAYWKHIMNKARFSTGGLGYSYLQLFTPSRINLRTLSSDKLNNPDDEIKECIQQWESAGFKALSLLEEDDEGIYIAFYNTEKKWLALSDPYICVDEPLEFANMYSLYAISETGACYRMRNHLIESSLFLDDGSVIETRTVKTINELIKLFEICISKAQIADFPLDDLTARLAALHAKEYDARYISGGLSDSEIDQVVKKEYPKANKETLKTHTTAAHISVQESCYEGLKEVCNDYIVSENKYSLSQWNAIENKIVYAFEKMGQSSLIQAIQCHVDIDDHLDDEIDTHRIIDGRVVMTQLNESLPSDQQFTKIDTCTSPIQADLYIRKDIANRLALKQVSHSN